MLVGFMASRTGRWLRILAGAGLVVGGLTSSPRRGTVLVLAGLGPLVAGALDLCLLGPLFGHSIRGEEIRRKRGGPVQLKLFPTHYERLSPRARMLMH